MAWLSSVNVSAAAAALLGCGLWATFAAATESVKDPALVIHYAFDQDAAGVAKDMGAHGNDGRIAAGLYVPEAAGRRGVVRLDGKSSHINCGEGQSQHFSGDMSLEMWVRANGQAKPAGTLFGWGGSFQIYAAPLIVDYGSGDNHTRMELANSAKVLTDRWSHVAMVVEYPRIRLYHNGDMIRDGYMPIEGVADDKAAKVIGSGCAIDLDEFRLYRRALTAEEIAAHAKGRDLPPGRAEELVVEPNWYENTVAVRLSCKGADAKGRTAEIRLPRADGADAAPAQEIALAESSPGSGRYVGTATFPLAGLQDKFVDAVARIAVPDGAADKTVFRHAHMGKPAWIHTKEGYAQGVPAPWTPLEAQAAADGTAEVRVWGRKHGFGPAMFPARIEIGGTDILASPIRLSGRADGKDIAFDRGRVNLKDSSKTAASLEQACDTDVASAAVTSSVEFDGYMIFDCRIKARRDTTIDALTLEIPLRTAHATLCFGGFVYPEKQDPQIPMSTLYMGAVKDDLAFRFSPCIWLGDEDRGLTWQAESNEDWRYADPQKAIEILPRGEVTRFVAHWIGVPTKLAAGESLHYKFALQATPVKPLLRDAWDLRILRSDPYTGPGENPDLNLPNRWIKIDHAKQDRIYSVKVDELNLMEPGPGRKPALQYYVETGARHLWITPHDNWPWPTPTDPGFARELHGLIDAAHAAGLGIYSYLIHERIPTNVPEFDIYGLDMSALPMAPYEGTVGFCPKSQALQDAVIYNLARRLDEYGDDGVYLDGTGAHLITCQNTAHGCGYRARQGATHPQFAVAFDQAARGSAAKDGAVYPTYPVFAQRELIRRIYNVVKQRRPQGVVDVHSWYYNSGALAYADMLWTGEQWWHLRGKGVKYVAPELTLDTFRTMFMGRQIGVAAETLPYRLIGSTQKNAQVAATSLLHDIPVRIRTQDTEYFDMMSRLWKLREEFGAKEAEKLFYWNNQGYVQVQPEKCYATLLAHPKNGVLAFVSNLRPDKQTVTVQLRLDKLGLSGGKLEAANALTNEPAAMSDEGKLSLPLGSEEWMYLWIKPKGP